MRGKKLRKQGAKKKKEITSEEPCKNFWLEEESVIHSLEKKRELDGNWPAIIYHFSSLPTSQSTSAYTHIHTLMAKTAVQGAGLLISSHTVLSIQRIP